MMIWKDEENFFFVKVGFNLKSEGGFLLSSGHMEIILLLAYVSTRNHNQSYREWQTAQGNFCGQKEPARNNTTNMSPLIKSHITLSSSFSLKKEKTKYQPGGFASCMFFCHCF